MQRWLLSSIVGVALLHASQPLPSPAQTKGKTSGAGQAQQDQAKQAITVLQEDLKQLAQSERELASSMANVKKLMKSVSDAEKKAQSTLERSMGLDQLLATQRSVRSELKVASGPVVEELHKSEEFIKAKTRADVAKQRLTQIKTNTNLAADEKRRMEQEAAEAGLVLTRMEQEAVEQSPKTKELKAKSAKVDKEIAALRAKIKDAVESDNGVATAEVELEKAQAEFKQQQRQVAALRQKAGYDQQVAAKEQQEAQLAQMLERMKSSKGKSKKKR